MQHLQEYDAWSAGFATEKAAIESGLVKGMLWDEYLSMAVDRTIETAHNFVYFYRKGVCMIIKSTHSSLGDLISDLDHFGKKTLLLGACFHPNEDIITGLVTKFQPSEKDVILLRSQSIPDYIRAHPTPMTSALSVCSEETPQLLQDKVAVEHAVFKYNESYVNQLPAAMTYLGFGDPSVRREMHFVFRDADRPIAYMTIRFRDGVVYLQGAGVLEEYRRQGINKYMLDHCMRVSHHLGYLVMALCAWDEIATEVWEKAGFHHFANAYTININ
ncbi:hypothetical protein HDV03_001169 [Kappamyces sp. JEL0829]|nr:hypothetical protein HDV03_001169 [Kappamyces sp. JEL0829]